MGDDSTSDTGSSLGSMFGGSNYRPSYNFTDTESTVPSGNVENTTTPGYNYGDTTGSSGSSYIPWYDQKAMVDQDQFGPSLMGSDRVAGNDLVKDTGQRYDWTDDLNNYWNKYKKYFQFGAGMLARTNPAFATAYGLYNIFNNPRNATAGAAGGTLGSVIGGAINPVLSGVGGQIGSQMAQGAAANAEGKYGTATPPQSSGTRDYGALGAGLGQIWNRYGTAKEYSNQGKQLQDLYGPNSAYSQQLQQSLLRQDASRGRRSQFGTRNVELQARLAELASRNAPQLQQLTKAKADEKNKMYTDLYSFGRGLYDIM